MNDHQLRKTFDYPIYRRDSKIFSDRGFVNIDNGSMGGTHWTCLIIKDNNSYHFQSVVGQPDTFLLGQLPKQIVYQNYEIPHINSRLCGSYCLYSFYSIERMNYYHTILNLYFG